jgi:hypothetical protein
MDRNTTSEEREKRIKHVLKYVNNIVFLMCLNIAKYLFFMIFSSI